MSYSFRNRPKLSDRYRGKSGDEILNELKNQLDEDRKMFFESSPGWNSAQSPGSYSRTAHNPLDDMMSRGRQDIRSHLDDLAQRHPEFADHLRCPPWGGEMGTSQGSWGRKRCGSGDICDEASSAYNEPPPQDPKSSEEPSPSRGRPRESNLPQYGLRNTVDLGQQQQEQSEGEQDKGRGQRSWSAPPDNRTQNPPESPRYVSRLDIPVNSTSTNTAPDQGKPPVAPKHNPQPQPQAPQQPQPNTAPKPNSQGSTVRHIPIFVEGRDEPLLPKEAKQTEVPTERIFSDRTVPPSSTFNYGRPSQFTSRSQPQQQPPPQTSRIPPQTTFGQGSSSQKSKFNQPQQQQQQQPPQQHQTTPHQETSMPAKQESNQGNAAPPQPKQPPVNDPISRVQAVQKEVDNLKVKVAEYSGNSRKDKDYLYLDEMLTRNLLKLDDIETEGRDDVRQARKSAIRDIQKCISDLESLVPNAEDGTSDSAVGKSGEEMAVEQTGADAVAGVDIQIGPAESGELKMETDLNPVPPASLADLPMEAQVSGSESSDKAVQSSVVQDNGIAPDEHSHEPVQIPQSETQSGASKLEDFSSEMQIDETSKVQPPVEAVDVDSSSKDTVSMIKKSDEAKSDSPKVQSNPPLNIKLSSKMKSPKSPKKGKRSS